MSTRSCPVRSGASLIACTFMAIKCSGFGTRIERPPGPGNAFAEANSFSAVSPCTYMKSTRPLQRRETLRFHERDERILCGSLGYNVQVQRHPRMSIGGKCHAADHRN